MNSTIALGVLSLIKDMSWVALFGYAINRATMYAMRRIEVYGVHDTLLPPNVDANGEY